MEKSNLIRVILILVMSTMFILFSTNVFAADGSDDFNDLTSTLNNTAADNTTTNLVGNSSNNALNTNKTNNTNNINNTSNTSNTNNASIYNNTNLPKTGIGDSIPVAMLVVVFGISAVYAYKKVKEYRNI